MPRPRHITRRDVVMALLASLVSRPLGARTSQAGAPASIAVPGFAGASPDELEKGHELARLIASDLRDSGLFTLVDPDNYSGIVINVDTVPEFGDWRALHADCLVTGRLSLQPDGRFKVEFRLWDVMTAKQLQGAQYFVTPNQWPRIPHMIAGSIYQRLTGQAGRFDEENKN